MYTQEKRHEKRTSQKTKKKKKKGTTKKTNMSQNKTFQTKSSAGDSRFKCSCPPRTLCVHILHIFLSRPPLDTQHIKCHPVCGLSSSYRETWHMALLLVMWSYTISGESNQNQIRCVKHKGIHGFWVQRGF